MEIDLESIKQAIKNSSPESAVYVGCDSKRRGDRVTYTTVVIIHFDQKRGGAVFQNNDVETAYQNARDGVKLRMLGEAYRAGDLASKLIEVAGDRKFEVHLDINPDPKHFSSVAYQEAKGMIMGYVGIEPKFKPEAFAASSVADFTVVRESAKGDRRRKKNRRIRRRQR